MKRFYTLGQRLSESLSSGRTSKNVSALFILFIVSLLALALELGFLALGIYLISLRYIIAIIVGALFLLAFVSPVLLSVGKWRKVRWHSLSKFPALQNALEASRRIHRFPAISKITFGWDFAIRIQRTPVHRGLVIGIPLLSILDDNLLCAGILRETVIQQTRAEMGLVWADFAHAFLTQAYSVISYENSRFDKSTGGSGGASSSDGPSGPGFRGMSGSGRGGAFYNQRGVQEVALARVLMFPLRVIFHALTLLAERSEDVVNQQAIFRADRKAVLRLGEQSVVGYLTCLSLQDGLMFVLNQRLQTVEVPSNAELMQELLHKRQSIPAREIQRLIRTTFESSGRPLLAQQVRLLESDTLGHGGEGRAVLDENRFIEDDTSAWSGVWRELTGRLSEPDGRYGG